MKTEMNQYTMGDIISAINHYSTLFHCLPAASLPKLNDMLDNNVFGMNARSIWNDVDMHVVQQTWGNTACGWGGIGGQAFTTTYTVVFENSTLQTVAVYYNGRLAYLADFDDAMEVCRKANYKTLPDIATANKIFSIIYCPIKERLT